jgi:hypothetical protein
VPPAEGSTKAAEHAVKPVPARRASDELHSHWGRLARSLGLKLDIDLPFLDTAETPAAPTPQTAASDESRDPLAYEVPPVQEPDTSPSEETHWQEHRGEFDEPESLDTLAEYEGVETSEVEPPSAGEPPVERRRRRRRRRRPRTPAGEAISPQPDRLALDSSAQSASEPGFRDETSGPPDLHDTESPSTSEADAMAGRFKHAKIPTWEQAVGYIIDQNLAQRSRAGMDSRRGRYGRR